MEQDQTPKTGDGAARSSLQDVVSHAPQALTEEDARMIAYFWQEKGDLERWIGWPGAKPRLEHSRPEILKAWNEYKMSIATLNALVASLHG